MQFCFLSASFYKSQCKQFTIMKNKLNTNLIYKIAFENFITENMVISIVIEDSPGLCAALVVAYEESGKGE